MSGLLPTPAAECKVAAARGTLLAASTMMIAQLRLTSIHARRDASLFVILCVMRHRFRQ